MTTQPAQRPVIVLAFANDRDDHARYLRNLALEASTLQSVLESDGSHERWEVVVRQNATLERILDVFQDPRYRGRIVVFHFGGHAGSNALQLESTEGTAVSADASVFVTFLRSQHELRLVFLNGCSTQGQVNRLLAAGVPSVIATSSLIDDHVATRFASRFYKGLAGGAGLRVAFEEAVSSQQPAPGAGLRDIHRKGVDLADARWPWELHLRDGAAALSAWTLAESAGEPLLGLPPLPPTDLPPKPYRHLNWFGREHAPLFFGRGREIRDLFECLTSAHTAPITLLYGQSGVGKSSLLAAGLLPRLASIATTRYVRRDRDARLSLALRQAIGLEGPEPLRDGWAAVERADGRPLIVLLDQVEEVFTRPHADDPNELDDFLIDLSELFLDRSRRPAGKLLLGFRKEWLADIEDRIDRLTLPHGKVFVNHLDADGIAEAVAGPARQDALRRHYRLTIEDGLPERIATDLLEDRGSPIAPALQLLLSKLWDRAVAASPESPRFDAALYARLKREGVLLDDFVEQQLAALDAWRPELSRVGLFLDFLAHHATEIGSARPCSRSDLEDDYRHHGDLLPEIVARCRDLLLLVDAVAIDGAAGAEGMTRLVHDAVAQLVRRRFEQSDRPGQQARRLLERRARAWADGATGETLDEDELALTEAGSLGMRRWTAAETRLIEASRAEREVGLQRRRASAVVRALLGAREAQDDPLIAALLVAELADLPEPEDDIRPAIRTIERAFPCAVLDAHARRINSVAFSPDGTLLATGSDDGTARIWTLATPGSFVELTDHADAVTCVAFSPDGRRLATASADGTALIHSVDRHGPVQALFGHAGFVLSCAFSPDGRRVVTTSTDCTARVWTLDDSEPPRVFEGRGGPLRSVTFNAASDALLTIGSGDGLVRSLDSPGAVSIPSDGHVVGAAFLPDGNVVWMDGGGEVHLSEFSGHSRGQSRPLADGVPASAFGAGHGPVLCASPSSARIAFSNAVDALTVLDVLPNDAIQPAPVILRAPGSQIVFAEFDRQGSKVFARCADGTARFWLPSDSGPVERVLTHAVSPIQAAAFSPDGSQVATAAADGTVRLWTTAWFGHARALPLPGHFVTSLDSWSDDAIIAQTHPWVRNPGSAPVETLRVPIDDGAPTLIRRRFTGMERSPDSTRLLVCHGRELVVVSCDASVPPFTIAGNLGEVTARQFTPDGSYVLVHTSDATLQAWNLSTAECEWKRRGIASAKCSPDGAFVLTIGVDGMARLLAMADGDGVWSERDVAAAEFIPPTLGVPSYLRLERRDRSMLLRSTRPADPIVRFDGDASSGANEATIWMLAKQRCVVHLPAMGGVLSICSLDGPDQRHVLTADASLVDVRDGGDTVLAHLRNGDVQAWSTAQWQTQPPGEGRLIATGVARVDSTPDRSRVVIHLDDGVLALLDRNLTAVERTLFTASEWSWSPSGTSIAGWLAEEATPDDVQPARYSLSTPLSPSTLRVAHIDSPEEPIVLGRVSDWRSPALSAERPLIMTDVRWLDDWHIAATIDDIGDPRVDELAVWDVRAAEQVTGGPPTVAPRRFGGGKRGVRQAIFHPQDRFWLYADDYAASVRCESLTRHANGQVVSQPIDGVRFNWPVDIRRSAFGDGNQLAVIHVGDDTFCIGVEGLGPARTSKIVAYGSGSVEHIAFSPDGQALDIDFSRGQVMHVALDRPAMFVPARAVEHFVLPTGHGVLTALTSDGGALIWADDMTAPARLSVAGRRIGVELGTYSGLSATITIDSRTITATLDDGSVVRWETDSSGDVRHLPAAPTPSVDIATDDGVAVPLAQMLTPQLRIWDHASPDGRFKIRYGDILAQLVRSDDTAPPFPLESASETPRGFDFSADSQWLVAEVEEPEDRYAFGLRIWNTEDPASSRLLPNVVLVRVQGNFLHIRRRQTDVTEVIPFSGADEPLVVPRDAIAIGPGMVMYLGAERSRRGIHLVPVDRAHESTVLLPPTSSVEAARHRGDLVVGVANGELYVWDLLWKRIGARIRAATTATLSPEQRRRLLGDR